VAGAISGEILASLLTERTAAGIGGYPAAGSAATSSGVMAT